MKIKSPPSSSDVESGDRKIAVFVVADHVAGGDASFYRFQVQVDDESFALGRHYDLAVATCLDANPGYRVAAVFDETDAAGRLIIQGQRAVELVTEIACAHPAPERIATMRSEALVVLGVGSVRAAQLAHFKKSQADFELYGSGLDARLASCVERPAA